MRKKKLMVLSLVLVMLQLVSLLAIFPVSAAATMKYLIYKTDTAPLLNGIADSDSEAWDNVPWSETFKKTAGDNASGNFSAKFKMMWSENTEAETISLWYYIYVEDSTTTKGAATSNWTNDYFALSIASGSTKLYSNGRVEIDLLPAWEDRVGNAEYLEESAKNESTFKDIDVDLGWQDNRADKGYYAIEYMVTIPKEKIGSEFKFDVMVNDHTNKTTGSNAYSRNAWSTMNNTDVAAPVGIGILSVIPADVANVVSNDPYASTTKNYTFYKAMGTPDESTWNALRWSEDFYKTGGSENADFNANFKALWVDNTNTVDLWFYLLVKDSDDTQKTVGASGWTDDYVTVSIDANRDGDGSDSGEIDSGFRAELENIGEDGKITYYNRNITFKLVDKRTSDGYYVVTMCIPITKTLISDNKINFDLMANNCGSSTSDVYTRIGWNGMNNTSYVGSGIGYLSEYANPADEPISTEPGAGTRLKQPAGLRFETHVNKEKYDALSSTAQITTGTLIVPTDYLTYYGIDNSNFTKASLDALNISYLDIVNEGWANSETAASDGYYKFYGSIVGIKYANLDRNFSGVGYMTVKTATEEYTLYGGYKSVYHSRSVQYVAKEAIASGEYNEYLDILQGFIKDTAPVVAEASDYGVTQYSLMNDEEVRVEDTFEVPCLEASVLKNVTYTAIECCAPDVLAVNEKIRDTWSDLADHKPVCADTTIGG